MRCLKACCGFLPQRYVTSIMVVIGLITCYLMRVCLNLAINEMTFAIAPVKTNKTENTYCSSLKLNTTKEKPRAEFHWDQQLQHDIIKSIYIGYIIAHVPAGVLADTFGGKYVFGAGILLSALCSICFPTLAKISPYAFMVGRVVQGFGQGVMFPSMSSLVAKWSPPQERATMTGIVQSGIMLGNAAGYIISGLILGLFPGWQPIFYICGVVALIWCAFWFTLCYSSPDTHPFISEKEKNMILSSLSQTGKKKPKHIPWKSILTSVPFISSILANFGHAWALFTMVNEMPVYMSKVLKFNIKLSGLYSALPHIAMVPTSIGTGYLCDWLIKRKYMNVTNNRKLFTLLANFLPIPFMIGASFAGCDRTIVIILFMVMMFFKGMSYATCRANPVDLSPNYAGILMGFMNGSGAIAGLLGPVFTPLFLEGDGSIEQWRNVFYLGACIMVLFTIQYACFGSGDLQSWNDVFTEDSADNSNSPPERSSEQK